MSSTARGVIMFITAIATIGIWAPLRNRPERLTDGTIVTQTYFGLLTYGTLRTELKEPHYKMDFTPHPSRIAGTLITTAVLWTAILLLVRQRRGARPSFDRNPSRD